MRTIIILFILFISCYAFAQKKVKVVNLKNEPVKCGMYLNGAHILNADKDGQILVPVDCKFTDKIDIIPIDTETYDGHKGILCSTINKKIILYSRKELEIAYNNAFFIDKYNQEEIAKMDKGSKITLYGKIALASNEVYSMSVFPDSIREKARIQTIKYTAAALDVKNATYKNGSYIVPNETLIYAVGIYQAKNGIKASKKIDQKTLQMLSQKKSFLVWKEDFEKAIQKEKN